MLLGLVPPSPLRMALLAMVVLGLLLGVVGTDIYTSTPRFTFGITA